MPNVTVFLPGPLVRLFPEASHQVEVSADTVEGLLEELDARWPGMRDSLRDSRPQIRRHINIFVAGRRAKLGTPLPEDAEVYVLTAMSGG